MDNFAIQARDKEAAFWRKWKHKARFITCTGKENFLVELTSTTVCLTSQKKKEVGDSEQVTSTTIRISRDRLRAAMREFFYRRIITRKDLERYSNFNSALLALLRTIFIEMIRLKKSTEGYRLVMAGIRYFPAGCDRSVRDLEIIAASGAKFVLLSYYYLRQQKTCRWKYHVKRLGLMVLLDCGEFTRYQMMCAGKEVEPILVEDFGAFVMKHQDVIFGFFNLDVMNDPIKSIENELYLRNLGIDLRPIPVWHCQGNLENLAVMVNEQHPVIAIGGSVQIKNKQKKREIFQEVFRRFPEQCFHWLGGSSSLLFEFEWFSADSSTSQQASKFGKTMTLTGRQEKAPIGWSREKCFSFNLMHLLELEDPKPKQLSCLLFFSGSLL